MPQIPEGFEVVQQTPQALPEGFEVVEPQQITDPTEGMGLFEGIGEQVTGTARATEETEALPDYGGMPELSSFSLASFKSALGTMATNPEETVQVIQANFPGVEVRQDQHGNYIMRSSIDGQEYAIKPGVQLSDIPRAAGTMLAFTPAGRAKSIAGAALASGATQAGIEASQAATGGEFDPEEAAIAAGVGAVAPLATKGIQAVKGLTGAQTGATAAGQEAVKSAEAAGITPMTSDVLQPETFVGKWARTTGERIPVAGTGAQRAKQQATREDAILNVLREYGADDAASASDKVMKDLLSKHSADVNKYVGLKNEVFTNVRDKGAVPVGGTVNALDREISNLASLRTESVKPLMTELQDFKAAIQGQGIDNIEALRKQLGDKLAAPDMASVKTMSEKASKRIYKALRDDMGSFIKEVGDKKDFTKWSVANARLAEGMSDMRVTALKSALKKGDVTPEAVKSLLFSRKPSEIMMLKKGLTPQGKANARTAILQEVIERLGGIENLSTAKFETQLRKMDKPIQAFFTGRDRQAIKGLEKALRLTRRAGESGVNTQTGQELALPVGAAVITDLLGGAGAGLAGAASIGGIARVYESKPVRDALIKIAGAPKGAEVPLIENLITVIQTQRQYEDE